MSLPFNQYCVQRTRAFVIVAGLVGRLFSTAVAFAKNTRRSWSIALNTSGMKIPTMMRKMANPIAAAISLLQRRSFSLTTLDMAGPDDDLFLPALGLLSVR